VTRPTVGWTKQRQLAKRKSSAARQ